jgi:hypothetical protein
MPSLAPPRPRPRPCAQSGGGSAELDQLRQHVVHLEALLADEQAGKAELDRKLKKAADKISDLEDQVAEVMADGSDDALCVAHPWPGPCPNPWRARGQALPGHGECKAQVPTMEKSTL